ncbi:MAG: hypothetical protein Q9M91_01970 [Candidatus Dojkabacteria bacterium]|nr:hypothetical protein [Candidatus Dojkabacteria bacterium]MDQ7020591.1 hypothetical protein [Candidatus Dojkabacteria bacterium]
MLKVYCGDDTFESYYASKSEAKNIADKKNLNVKIINCDELKNIDSFLSEVETIGMFSEESVIFAKRFLGNKKLSEYLETNIEKLSRYEIIIWHDKKPDGRLKIFKKLKQEKLLFEYKEAKEYDLKSWVITITNEQEIRLSDYQISYLIESLDLNKWLIKSELKKVEIFLENQGRNTLLDDELEKLLGFDIKGNIWKFLDYFGNRNRIKLIQEYIKLVSFERNTQMIIAMISREIDILLQLSYASENNINTKELGLHPFVVNKSKSKLRNFSKSDLAILNRKLFDLDFAVKTGKIDEEVGMSLYLVNV